MNSEREAALQAIPNRWLSEAIRFFAKALERPEAMTSTMADRTNAFGVLLDVWRDYEKRMDSLEQKGN